MEKIRLGKTDLIVTKLGFGGIPIQRVSESDAIAVVKRCLELGINFFDTANGYTTSEERIGKAIAGRRGSVVLASKSQSRTREGIAGHFKQSLKQLEVDTIDLYQFHNVSDLKTLETVLAPGGPISVLEEARSAGRVKYIGVTSHQIDTAKKAVATGRFDTIMFPFNVITCEAADELLPLCRQYEVGFIAMKPLAGGMLQNISLAIKYLFQFPDVLTLTGIEKIAEIEEIIRVLEGPRTLTRAENGEITKLREELGSKFCHRCDYCQPCKESIPISVVMTFHSFRKRLPAERLLSGWIADALGKAADCTQCGECEPRCPYHLPIREMITAHLKEYRQYKNGRAN